MSDFTMQIISLMERHQVRGQPPLSKENVEDQLAALHVDMDDLTMFYMITNGLDKEWFKVFPLLDTGNIKKTWNSLSRVNTPGQTLFLRNNPELLERFLVFASIGGGNCAVVDRTDHSIWFQEDGLHQTDLTLFEFIETELREVDEL